MKTLPQSAKDSSHIYGKVSAHMKGLRHTKSIIKDPGESL